MKSRLEIQYKDQMRSELAGKLGVNVMQVPRIEKIVVNMGVKEAVSDGKVLNSIRDILTQITGQTAVKTTARNSIAGFKLRAGVAIGTKVTLRGDRMYHFLDKLINLALPCVRDFQGVTHSFDGNGNYNLGIKDWMIFPEIDYDMVDKARGMNITIQTTAENDEHARALLDGFKMPFKRA